MVGSNSNANVEVTAQLVWGQALGRAIARAISLDFPPLDDQRSAVPTVRDLVSALRRLDGVDAAIVLGRDGALIDGATDPAFDPDGLAACVPPVALAAIAMGGAAGRGDFGLMVLEYSAGAVVVTSVTPDAFLFVLLRPEANLAALLYDLRRFRAQIASLV